MFNKTIKNKIGGSLSNTSGLQHILSIGYEVECSNLMKLTKSETEDPSELILFNSDTLVKDVNEIKKIVDNNYGSSENIDYNNIARSEELVEIDVLDKHGIVDEKSKFYITNDTASYPFTKKLNKVCYYPSDEIKSTRKSKSEMEHADEKNELYIFRDTTDNKDYKIHFLFQTNRKCQTHSNVEWIFTYFKPKRGVNVIINTFLNMIKNLVRHTSDLKPIRGNFIMKYKDANNIQEELIIDNPKERLLYHKPDTNLYYLQNQVSDKPFTIDGTCAKIQMTFSSKIENVYTILKTILTDKKNAIPSITKLLNGRLKIIENIRARIDELIDNYNKTDTSYKIFSKSKKTTDIEIIKNYLFLILYKIDRYYVFKKRSEKQAKYFKNLLFVNCRHSNHNLYVELKKTIQRMFVVDNTTAVSIITKIVFQPEILNKIVTPEIKDKLRKGVFLSTNTLDKTHRYYGDPIFSLVSYFDFFEEPIKTDKTNSIVSTDNTNSIVLQDNDIPSIKYDWLEYADIDTASARMDLKDDIILIECRNFQELISSYVYSIADSELKNQMKNGACNIIANQFSEDVPALSIGNFKKVIEILNLKGSKKTLKKTSVKNTV